MFKIATSGNQDRNRDEKQVITVLSQAIQHYLVFKLFVGDTLINNLLFNPLELVGRLIVSLTLMNFYKAATVIVKLLNYTNNYINVAVSIRDIAHISQFACL